MTILPSQIYLSKRKRKKKKEEEAAAVATVALPLPRRTFLYLEQLILRHGAAARALRIAPADHGLDLFFAFCSHAASLVDFVSGVGPVRSCSDKQFVSHDPKSSRATCGCRSHRRDEISRSIAAADAPPPEEGRDLPLDRGSSSAAIARSISSHAGDDD